MKNYRAFISKVLTITLFFNSVICSPIYADPVFDNDNASETLFDSENTEDSLETTALNIKDNVESSSGIIVDILDGIKDIFDDEKTDDSGIKIEVEDTVLSDSALDFNLDTSSMTDEVIDIVNGKKPYSKLSQYEKYLLMEQVGVREDTMTECEDVSYSIMESIPKALIMQRMCFDLNDALKMIRTHKSENAALEETDKYVSKSYECSFMNDEEIFGELSDLLKEGYTTDDVINAFVVSAVLETDVKDIIKRDTFDILLSDNPVSYVLDINNDNNDDELKNLADDYCVDVDALDNYASSEGIDIYSLEEEIKIKAGILGVSEEKYKSSAATLSSSDNKKSENLMFDTTYNTGPVNINDTQIGVSKGTGALSVSKEICNIPGVNGLDLKLSLNYSSSSGRYNKIENRFLLPDNWSLSLPYLMDKDGNSILYYNIVGDYYRNQEPKYITLGNGESYYLGRQKAQSGSGVYVYKAQLCYNDELYLYEDKNSILGSSTNIKMQSKYKLRYKDGKYDYFNNQGEWLGRTDKFGNTIRLIKDEFDVYKILDTKKNAVTINTSGTRVSTIVTPDNKTFKINYGSQSVGDGDRRTVSSFTDGENNVTSFEYTFFEGDNKGENNNKVKYKNVLMTKMKLPSGLEYRYSYELANVASFYSSVDSGFDYPRVVSESIYYDGVSHNQKQYTYSSRNYTDANSNPVFLCTCDESKECCDCYNKNYATNPCSFYLDDDNGWKCSLCDNCRYDKNTNDDFYYTMTEKENNSKSTTYRFDVFNRLTESSSTDKTVTYTYNDGERYGNYNPSTIVTIENNTQKTEEFNYTRVGEVGSYKVFNDKTLLHHENHYYDWNGDYTKYNLETKAEYFFSDNEKITVTNTLSNSRKTIGTTKITNNSGEIVGYNTFLYNLSTEGGQLWEKVEYLDYDPNKNDYYNAHRCTRYTYSTMFDNTKIVEGSPVRVEKLIKEYGEYDESFAVDYAYDQMGRKIEEKTAKSLTQYEYNGVGAVTKEIYSDKSGRNSTEKTYTYNYSSNMCDIKDENGNVIRYDFDPAGYISKVSQGNNVLATYTYNNRMLLSTMKDGKSVTSYTYDSRDRVTSEVVKEGSTVLSNKTYAYENNATGLKTTEKMVGNSSANTITNITQADIMGQNVMENYAGNIYYNTYDLLGNKTVSKNYISSGKYLNMYYTYDCNGNATSAKRVDDANPSTSVTTTATYDMLGRIKTSTDAKGNTTEYWYNAIDKLSYKDVPLQIGKNGEMEYINYIYVYDSVGNLTKEIVRDGVTNKYTYDHRNRLTKVKTGDQYVDYTYDNVGNITSYCPGGKGTHNYQYDGLNRLVKYNDGRGGNETYTYDSNQDMVKKVDRNGNTITYTYDGLHRKLTEKTDGVNNSWTYGLTGGVISESNDDVSKTYVYNSKGLVKSESVKIGSDTFKIERTYDTRGNNLQRNYFKNNVAYYSQKNYFDNKNRLSAVGTSDGKSSEYDRKVNYYYDVNDNLTSAHYGNNTYQVYYYNYANLIHCMDMVDKSDNSKLEHIVLRYKGDGNISSKTEAYGGYESINTSYTYDSSGRLSKESISGDNGTFSYTYTYDAAGNRLSKNDLKYNYDSNNRLISEWNGTTGVYYQYDNNGNMIKKDDVKSKTEDIVTSTKQRFYTYNALNQLVNYHSDDEKKSADYKYMPNGYLYEKNATYYILASKMTQNTGYIWDGDNITQFLDGENNVTDSYCRGYNLICDNNNKYYMHDIHGNLIETYKSDSRRPYDRYYYTAFGSNSGYDDTDFIERDKEWGYCDQLYDSYAKAYYMRARFYDVNTGRFISEDTHWNPSNMIYGDSTARESAFGLDYKYKILFCKDSNLRSFIQSIWGGIKNFGTSFNDCASTIIETPDAYAIFQSCNKYSYCMSNPVLNADTSGNNSAVAGASIGAAVAGPAGAVIGAAVGTAVVIGVSYMAAEHTKLRGSKKKTNDKHTKPRPGRSSEKKKQKSNWKSRK